jgi:hypothetical protein
LLEKPQTERIITRKALHAASESSWIAAGARFVEVRGKA